MKKRNRCLGSLLTAGVLACGGLLFSGCEVDSPDEAQITVSPDYARLAVGQTVTLTASGWGRYQWSLGNAGAGRLSATTGERVAYTALAGDVTQTVTANAAGDQVATTGSGTNAVVTGGRIAAGTATIIQ